ncbi:MAG: hypothetical protein CMF61_02040 [Magnetococcales bacterium]|nr:hypothetical protein [Magnetococcales bacterium]
MNLYDVVLNGEGEVMLCIPEHAFSTNEAQVHVYPQRMEIWSEGKLQVRLGGIPLHIIRKALNFKGILVGEFPRMSETPSRQYMASVVSFTGA